MKLDELFSIDNLRSACAKFVQSRTDKLEMAVGKDPPKVRIPTGIDRVDYTILLDGSKQREKFLQRISNLVNSRRFIFSPFRERNLPKPGGGTRTISICTVRDAFVQYVLLQELEKEVDSKFSRSCFGYRTGKSANKAISVIKRHIKQGWIHIFDGDIRAFFDNVPHVPLLENFRQLMPNASAELKKLIRAYLKAKRLPPEKFKTGKWMQLTNPIKDSAQPRMVGLPQGGALSGFLTNIYLNDFDRVFDSDPTRFKLVRYADDFVVLCKKAEDLAEARRLATESLEQLQLQLHPDKTHETSASAGFDFLGYRLRTESDQQGVLRLQIRVKSSTLSKRYKKLSKLFREARDNNWCSCTLRYRLNLRLVGVDPDHQLWKKKIRCNSKILPDLLKERSWIRYFVSVNRTGQLRKMDKWIKAKLRAHSLFYKEATRRDSSIARCWCRTKGPKRLFRPLLTYVREFYRLREAVKGHPD